MLLTDLGVRYSRPATIRSFYGFVLREKIPLRCNFCSRLFVLVEGGGGEWWWVRVQLGQQQSFAARIEKGNDHMSYLASLITPYCGCRRVSDNRNRLDQQGDSGASESGILGRLIARNLREEMTAQDCALEIRYFAMPTYP